MTRELEADAGLVFRDRSAGLVAHCQGKPVESAGRNRGSRNIDIWKLRLDGT